MPFINGKFYVNPAYGRGVERARVAPAGQNRDEPDDNHGDAHWVTIDHRHILIHETQGGENPKYPHPQFVVIPKFGKEVPDSADHKSQGSTYTIVKLNPHGGTSPLAPEDGDHQLALIEKFASDSKNRDVHICNEPCRSATPNSLTDTSGVTAGKPHAVVKRFTIDGSPARIYDAASGKAYDYVRADAHFNAKHPSFTYSYGNDPKR